MEYLKPQSPIKIGENYIYPLTTSDQIINGDGERIKNIADTNEICYLYSAIFSLDSWIGEGPYTQAATLTAVDGGGQVTAQSTLLACVGIDSTLPQETKDAMQSAASDIVNAEKTLGANTISVSLINKPDVEIELYFLIKEGNGSNIPPLNPIGSGGGMKLLWTNPNPEDAFLPQTIELNLKSYRNVIITAHNINGQYIPSAIINEKNVKFELVYPRGYQIGLRDITFTDSGIIFYEGKIDSYNSGTGGTTNNNYIVPTKIYGINF